MDRLREMLGSSPHHPSALEQIARCVTACFECAAVCTSCADACLAEQGVGDLATCIRLDLDCADVCVATGRLVTRLHKPNRALTEGMLRACVAACEACATECERHAGMHEHCRICAAACRHCAIACQDVLEQMPA